MSTFDDDERSATANRPIDLYNVTTPTATYLLTSHQVNVVYAGNTYLATTMGRSAQQIAQDLTGRELVVMLPISHELVQRFAASGIPEHQVLVTLLRLQQRSGIATQQWQGFGNGMSIEGHVASLRVPSVTDDAMKIKLPVIRAQKICNHVLYDALCSVDRFANAVTTTIVFISAGQTVIVTAGSVGSAPQMVFGELLHIPTGQRRMILNQTGTTDLTINVPIVGAQAGDAITCFPGCDHTVETCRDKYNNVINFGGLPLMNTAFSVWRGGNNLTSVQQP